MSKWAGKYVIGLTGNVGTGKSVVRKMLEHLGAYCIDADALSHRAIAKGAPAYQPVLETFGRWILDGDGQIDRSKLGKLVFSDPAALEQLEAIVHPFVIQAVDILVQRATQRVVVVEAIKLIESGMIKSCDSLWVTIAPPDLQMVRLMNNRRLTEAEARLRIGSQPPQEQKSAMADVIIRNDTSISDVWKQVFTAWQKTVPGGDAGTAPLVVKAEAAEGSLSVLRGKPRHSEEIAALLNRIYHTSLPVTADSIMAAFGEKAFLLLSQGERMVGLIGWQVENLVARTTDIVIDPDIPVERALPLLITEMEKASHNLQCEASLVFASPTLARETDLWRSLGYETRPAERLGVLAWMEAARESMPAGTSLFFKQLRQDRILRPI